MTQINLTNHLIVFLQNTKQFTPYKFKIRKGNNSVVIKNAFKNRWWWQMGTTKKGTDLSQINLYWDPGRNTNFLDTLPAFSIKKKQFFGTLSKLGGGLGPNPNLQDSTEDQDVSQSQMSDSTTNYSCIDTIKSDTGHNNIQNQIQSNREKSSSSAKGQMSL